MLCYIWEVKVINKNEFEISGILNWHNLGYTGKNIKIANLEKCSIDAWYLKNPVNDPFDNGRESQGNSHGNQTLNVISQVAPDADFYTLPRGGVYKKDSVTGRLIDESLPFMVSEKIHLVNASVGGTNNEILNNALEYVKSCGTTFVCSAGNSGDRGVSPYAQSGVWVAVGAAVLTDRGDINLTTYSSMGEEVDFVQFGEVFIHDILDQNRIMPLGGTSFSSPLLTGMLALVQQFFLEKAGHALSQEQLYRFMIDNSVDLGEAGKDIEYGHGLFVLPVPEDINIEKYAPTEQDLCEDNPAVQGGDIMKVLLAAGHGAGDNRGGVCYNEGDNNYYYSLILKKELEKYSGIQADLLRKNITDNPALDIRAAAGAEYDLYFAIHSNAFSDSSVRGTEVWDSVEKPNRELAKAICDVTASLFGHSNRGVKYKEGQPGINWYGELRFNQAKSAMIVEMGFHTNTADCSYFKNNHETIAKAQSAVIAEHYKLTEKSVGTLIIARPTATVAQMQEWAKKKNAHQALIILAPIFYAISSNAGVNPAITYAQSAKETGFFKFGGVLDISFNNPCGMKKTSGGGDGDPSAHQRFSSWEEGIQAQVDHLALYAGAPGYPKFVDTPDPRHFPYLHGTAQMVEDLGGKWAPSTSYGEDIVGMVREIENIVVEETEKLDILRISLHGRTSEIEGIHKNNIDYIPMEFLGRLGYDVNRQSDTIIIEYKKTKEE